MSSILYLERLKKDRNYLKAYEIMQSIIQGLCPDMKLLQEFYGVEFASPVKDIIKGFLESSTRHQKIQRHHISHPAKEIYDARNKVESNKTYQKIHSALLKGSLPEVNDLEFFYGNYASVVHNVIDFYFREGLKRRCELSASTHLHRVGAVVFQMGMNDIGTYKYSTIAILHDSIEDLLNLAKDENGNSIGILNYKKFLDEFIPLELQSCVKILTNHYDLILQFVVSKLKAEDKALTIKNIQTVLNYLLNFNLDEMNVYIKRTKDLLANTEFKAEEEVFQAAKWECYKNLYLDNIALSSKNANDYRLFEIKGVDLSDNSHGKDALSIDSKIKNIIKNTLWGTKGYALHSSWIPLNRHIEEILEDSLYAAEYIVLKDILEVQSCLDFTMSVLIKFKKLKTIFYA